MPVRVGLIGVGRMGLPICANLVRAGHLVTAGDVRADLESAVAGCGARWAGTSAEVAEQAEVLITVLPGVQELRDVMLLPGGVLAALLPTATWIDMTSASPAEGSYLAAAADARGIEVLEAPAGGGVAAAETGELQLFVGGDAALLERHRALLETLASPHRIAHMGGRGAGYATKLLVNLLWFGQAVATTEAFLLASRAGIDLDRLSAALADSAAATEFIRRDMDSLLSGDYMASFGLDRCCEELGSVVALARETNVPFELSRHVERIYRRALVRFGPADGELLAAAMLEEQAGIKLRHRTA
jgi:3-hydroxyisobutyrate dehydrogenase